MNIEEMAKFCKAKGFVYPNSEIYGGMSGFFDYGPLGVELKNNIKQSFWKKFVQARNDVVGIDGSIITHPHVWKASGHVDNFSDIMVECSKCTTKLRADTLVEDVLKIQTDGLSAEQLNKHIKDNKISCPTCKSEFKDADAFNLMFLTYVGPKQDKDNLTYLRPETAQLIFADFKNVVDTSRVALPFGIAQIGKAFRNEISPREFLFRCREFEQIEIEYFLHPDNKDCPLLKDKSFKFNILTEKAQTEKKEHVEMSIEDMLKAKLLSEWHVYWLKEVYQWFIDNGINPVNLRLREHLKDELAHYSSACFDIEYNFPFGWREIHGNADRSDYDLSQHQNLSKKSLEIFDEATQKKVLPIVIEPSQGVDRAFLSFMFEAHIDDEKRGNIVLNLSPKLAPTKVGIFPLVKKDKLPEIAMNIYDTLKEDFPVQYDQAGSVGKRYARSDEIGIPYCLTIDFDSIEKNDVTIRDRNSTEQKRISIDNIRDTIRKLINEEISFKDL